MTEFLARAMPKSITFTLPSGWTMMFCGLMSRWMMSWLWATESAWHTCEPISATLRWLMAPRCWMAVFRSEPRTNSMTMKYVPESWPQS